MPALLPGQIAMEKTPGYFHTPGVARRIWEANNMTKLVTIIMIIIITIILVTMQVLIIRNPVDRMISDYNQFRSRHLDRGQVATYLHIYSSISLHIYLSTHLRTYLHAQDYPPLEHFLFTANGNINIGYQPLQRSIYHYHLVR